MLQFSTPCDCILHILLHIVDTWKPYKTVTIWPYGYHMVTVPPYRKPGVEMFLVSPVSHPFHRSRSSRSWLSTRIAHHPSLRGKPVKSLGAKASKMFQHNFNSITLHNLNLLHNFNTYCTILYILYYILSYYIILYIILCFSMLYRIILAVHCMIVFIILHFIVWYHMIYTISYGIVLFCIAWKHIMLYDIEIWYHVIFCCRLQNAILNHIMLIHIMAKKCTIIQYCSRLYCNINHINMFINCTPIHHTMIWYNVISHYIYLQCAVLWLQCIPLCHMHLKLSKLHSNTLARRIVQCIVIRPEQYSANDWIKMNHRLIRSQSI